MSAPLRRFGIAAALAVALCMPAPAAGQAFGLPEGVGAVTVAWQYVDNTGHRLSDGSLLPVGPSVTTSAFVEVDYGFTSRLSATVALPYVFARYTGDLPSFSRLPRDECRCWNSSFQDVALAARYQFGNKTWAVTPSIRYNRPSHDYAYAGEAVVGRNLDVIQLGLATGMRLTRILPRASVQASYGYSFVERAVDDVPIDHSSLSLALGYSVRRRTFVHVGGLWQRTHGGLRVGGGDLPFPGELTTPERFAQRDRLQRSNYFHLAGGLAYSTGPVDLFAGFTEYISGTDTHEGGAYTLGATWYFGRSQ